MAALTPTRPANAFFWIGLVLSILALVLVACPTLLAFAITLDPGQEGSAAATQAALWVLCCLFLGPLLLGLAMIAAGRPRRYG